MSYAIENLKFTIFGHGHDVTRNDSGRGVLEPLRFNFGTDYAVFTADGKFCWIKIHNGTLKKYDTETWTEVSQSTIPNDCEWITVATNITDDYGIAKKGTTIYLFDLSTDEIIQTGTCSLSAGYYDCVKGGNILRFATHRAQNSNYIYRLNVNDLSLDNVSFSRDFSGFIDEKSVLGTYAPPSFADARHMSSVNSSSWSYDWDDTASVTGSGGFPLIGYIGFAGNNKIWIPTYINNKWKIGEYNGLIVHDFENPSPTKYFGAFDTKIELKKDTNYAIYSQGRTSASVITNLGTYATDFEDIYLLEDFTDDEWYPRAMSDKMVLCANRLNGASKVFYI